MGKKLQSIQLLYSFLSLRILFPLSDYVNLLINFEVNNRQKRQDRLLITGYVDLLCVVRRIMQLFDNNQSLYFHFCRG